MGLKLGYMGLGLLMFFVILYIGNFAIIKSTGQKAKSASRQLKLLLGMILWQIYIFVVAMTGILTNFDPPPKFVIFLILPAFLFIGIFLYKNKALEWISKVPVTWTIYYQSFRIIVEVLFVYTVAEGILHPEVTIEGYNFDMVFGATALIAGFLASRNLNKYRKILIAWNYLGLAVLASIIFLFITTLYFPDIYSNPIKFDSDFGTYPYVLVPGFLMPSAVFFHILSLIQLNRH